MAVRVATADDAPLLAEMLVAFNAEFGEESPPPDVLAERLGRLLAGDDVGRGRLLAELRVEGDEHLGEQPRVVGRGGADRHHFTTSVCPICVGWTRQVSRYVPRLRGLNEYVPLVWPV